jgi:biopolymer transport protein TolQ
MSPLNLFLQADVVVKLVMLGCCWPHLDPGRSIFTIFDPVETDQPPAERFETSNFWAAGDIDAFHAAAAMTAPDRSRGDGGSDGRMAPLNQRPPWSDRAGTRERLASG